ncbi:hypothetical protein F4779DRAFT_642682 [Xylariaceae sp. FL0662B]|nr:hypothetical protein F4779DRAFT_642682 [Xylariaceae sp. FL0662B]
MSSFTFPDGHDISSKLLDTNLPGDDNKDDFACPILEALYPHLDLFSRKSGTHIDPLHFQRLKGRGIYITEDVRLHLVWSRNYVHIKPISGYFFNQEFWQNKVSGIKQRQALGFMRTYAYLIRHQSDFVIAKEENLIPESKNLHYKDFENFIQNAREIKDHDVSLRWEFGQLRLNRLNCAVRLFQPVTTPPRVGILQRLYYEEGYTDTSQFLQDSGAPLLFLFATLSLVLSAMQVILAAQADNPWSAFSSVSAWFSVVVVIIIVIIFLSLFIIISVVLISQLMFALRSRENNSALV